MKIRVDKKLLKILIFGIIINVVGRLLALKIDFPGFLNLTGTLYATYYGGWFIGAVVSIISGLISGCFCARDWYLIPVDFFMSLCIYFFSRNNRYLNRLMSVITLSLTYTIFKTIFLSLAFYAIYFERYGMYFIDALADYLRSVSVGTVASIFICCFAISFSDCFCGSILVFLVRRLYKFALRKKNARHFKKALGKKFTLSMLAFSFILSFMIPQHANAGININFVQRVYNSDNGLIGGCANDIAQTSDGSMWVATYGGLYRFNGNSFDLLDSVDSIRSVQCLNVDSNDYLWVGTNGAGVTVLDDDFNAIVIDTDDGLPSNSIRSLAEGKNGNYYIGTTAGLSVVTRVNDDFIVTKTYEEVENILRESVSVNGDVAILNTVGAVYIFPEDNHKNICKFDCPEATTIEYDAEGNLYLGTDSQCIYRYEKVFGQYRLAETIETPDVIFINEMYFNESGYIYLAADSGVAIVTPDKKTSIINTGIFDSSVEQIHEDYQGNIWFTSYRRGLLCLSQSAFIDMFGVCNAPAAVVNGVVKRDGLFYAGTDDGLFILDYENGRNITNEVTDYYAGIRIRCLALDAENNLIIPGYGKPLMALSPSGEFYQYIDDSLPQVEGRKQRYVQLLHDGTVMVSSEVGLTFIKDHKIVNTLECGDELQSGTVLNAVECEDGTLLLGSDGAGVEVLKNGKVEKIIAKKDGLCSSVILRIIKDRIGDGFFVMTGSGVCYMTPDYKVQELTGIPFFNNYDIYQKDDGNVFIFGGAGIYVVRYESLMANEGANAYTLLDSKAGLPGSISSNAWNYVGDDGYYYICGSTGIYSLGINDYGMRVDKYKAKIKGVALDGDYTIITNNNPIVVPRGVNKIDISMELNNFTTTDPYVRYYLAGVDAEKTKVASSNLGVVSYYNIPYGKYTFHIEVLNDNGRVLVEKVYDVIKEREAYETIPFRVFLNGEVFLIIMSLIVAMINGTVYTLTKKQNNEHEEIVKKLQSEKTEALEKSLRMEEEANKMKSEFLANMSHEIRTPINAIIGMGTMITRESHEETTKRYAWDIRNASKTLLALVNDILDFSKIESGKLELVKSDYDLSVLINDLINMISPKIEEKKLDFNVSVNPNIPVLLYGDDVRIEQIIMNILSNAVKYTQEGSVTFKMDYESVSPAQIMLKVSVTDTGIGIKAENIEKLFSPYERFDEQRNKKVEGTGLGMSITKSLLEKMDSNLEVSSVYGQGSTFAFAIMQDVRGTEPIGDFKKNAKNVVSEDARERFHAENATVLVVDDVEMNLVVAKNLLKRIKINVETVASGALAVDLCQHRKYDIIFLDAMMPGMSGEETLAAIKRMCSLNKETPIIVLTANAVKGAKEEYLSAGFDDYLSKPIDGIELEASIEKYLPDDKKTYISASEAGNTVESGSLDTEQRSEDTILDRLRTIDEMDVDTGIGHAGDLETYLVVCRSFYDTAKEKLAMIKDYYDTKDIKNYTIQVHALKSSARLIGALELSEKALALEMAGKSEDMDTIIANTDSTLDMYKNIYDKMNQVYQESQDESSDDETSKEEISEAELADAYSALKELAPMMDHDAISMLLDEIDGYKLPKEDAEVFAQLRKALKKFDWDEMERILKM